MKKALKYIRNGINIVFNLYLLYFLIQAVTQVIHEYSKGGMLVILMFLIMLMGNWTIFLQDRHIKKLEDKLNK